MSCSVTENLRGSPEAATRWRRRRFHEVAYCLLATTNSNVVIAYMLFLYNIIISVYAFLFRTWYFISTHFAGQI